MNCGFAKPATLALSIGMLLLGVTLVTEPAVHVSPDQTGAVLIYPYYNVNNGFQTNFSVTNTTNQAKIIKIRFRESGNSQDVLSFNVYMSPYDVWVATIRNAGGRANVFSVDKTCTIPGNDQTTSVGILNSTGWTMNTVYPDVTDEDAREGYIEVIEVGNIPAGLYADVDGDGTIDANNDTEIVPAITHANGAPSDCSVLTTAWLQGVGEADAAPANLASIANWQGDSVGDGNGNQFGTARSVANVPTPAQATYLQPPSGGLYGDIIYLNIANGAAYAADPVAIDGYATWVQHFLPNDRDNFLLPSLASGDVTDAVVINRSDGTGVATNWAPTVDATINDGDVNTPRSGTNPYPIAHVLMATSVMNDFFVDANFNAATDWVLTFPMRKHGIYKGRFTLDCDHDGTANGAIGTFDGVTSTNSDTCFVYQYADAAISIVFYDREEKGDTYHHPTIDVTTVIGPRIGLALTREVNILTVNSDADAVMGSYNNLAVSFDQFDHGWAQIDFDAKYVTNSASGLVSDGTTSFVAADENGSGQGSGADAQNDVAGVPVIGFAAIRGDKGVAGVTFGETIPHKMIVDDTP